MSQSEPARITARRIRWAILTAIVVVGTTTVSLRTRLGETDGAVPEGVRDLDDPTPAVANLDPALLRALRQAAGDAAHDGIEIIVNSGWRSREYQTQLLREAVAKHGSEEQAARWVVTANRSAHVSGQAVDIGPSRAATWLFKHGAEYGLCRIYRNEPWHYELRPTAVADGCPSMYADPSSPWRRSRVTARPAGTPAVFERIATPSPGLQLGSQPGTRAPRIARHDPGMHR